MCEAVGHRKMCFDDCQSPGDFFWTPNDAPARISFLCPCGCGALLGASVKGDNAWQWNGDLERPTLTPSIRHLDGCHWHGFLTDGEFRSC